MAGHFSFAEPAEMLDCVQQISAATIGPAATDVDCKARFPQEAIAALRLERLLAAAIPLEYGGLGCSLQTLAESTQIIGQSCAATAMIWAMHHIQIACLARHGITTSFFQNYLHTAAEQQRLLASITSEAGVGGNIRTSIAAIQSAGVSRREVTKNATVISYGEFADDFLLTARCSPESVDSDQALVLLHRTGTMLEKTGNWDTLGMRGTCSPSFTVTSAFNAEQILPVPFVAICPCTMVPVSHILWSAAWLGIAASAVAVASNYVRSRKGGAEGDIRLAEAANSLQLMRANLESCVREYESLVAASAPTDSFLGFGFALRLNNLKIASSELVVKIVAQCLAVTGIVGYKNDSPYSLGRHLRDAYSAASMIGNDRLYATNASLLLVHRGN